MKNLISILSIICLFHLSTFSQIDTLSLKTPEGIAAKMLEFLTCEKDADINWEEYRNLFLPSAQKISINDRATGPRKIRVLNVEEFIRYFGPQYPKKGFEEIVIGLEVSQFRDIANVFQSFHCKTPDGSYEARGVNSYMLVYNEDRWWIANTIFTNETESEPLPNKYLFREYQVN